MQSRHSVQWAGRESMNYSDDKFRLDMDCYFDPSNRSYTVILGDKAVADGKTRHLTDDELRLVEVRVRAYLESRRLFGFPLRRRKVTVVRSQSVV